MFCPLGDSSCSVSAPVSVLNHSAYVVIYFVVFWLSLQATANSVFPEQVIAWFEKVNNSVGFGAGDGSSSGDIALDQKVKTYLISGLVTFHLGSTMVFHLYISRAPAGGGWATNYFNLAERSTSAAERAKALDDKSFETERLDGVGLPNDTKMLKHILHTAVDIVISLPSGLFLYVTPAIWQIVGLCFMGPNTTYVVGAKPSVKIPGKIKDDYPHAVGLVEEEGKEETKLQLHPVAQGAPEEEEQEEETAEKEEEETAEPRGEEPRGEADAESESDSLVVKAAA